MQSAEAYRMYFLRGWRYLSLTAFFVLMVLLIYHFSAYLTYAFSSIFYPYELDYAEGIVWQQVLLIPGARMYGDINTYPFIVFQYPPLYHLAVKTLASFRIDYLIAGRALSVVSSVAIGMLDYLIIVWALSGTRDRYIAHLAALFTSLALYAYHPVTFWSPLMRVDMLAVALSFLGVYLALRSIARPKLLYGAMLAFVAALYTKQTSLAAPLAATSVLLLAQPKQTKKAITLGVGVALLAFLYLNWITEWRFMTHILQYNINRFSFARAVFFISGQVLEHFVFLVVAVATLCAYWRWIFLQKSNLRNVAAIREKLLTDKTFLLVSVFTGYFLVTSILLIFVGKSGSFVNYFVEWMCVGSVIVGMAVGYALTIVWRLDGIHMNDLRRAIGIGLPIALLCQVLSVSTPHAHSLAPVEKQQKERLLEKIHVAHKPVLSEDMVLLLKAGKEVPLEPAILTELASLGKWNERPLIELIKNRRFEFVIVTRGLTTLRYTPAMREAIEASYNKEIKLSDYQLYLPSD